MLRSQSAPPFPAPRYAHVFILYICISVPVLQMVPVMWSKVSQKEKNKCCILMHIYESIKMVLINLFAEPFLYKRPITISYGQVSETLPKVRKVFRTYWKVSNMRTGTCSDHCCV